MFLLDMLREFLEEEKEVPIWEKLDDLEYIDTEVNLLNKNTDTLILLFDYLELCPAGDHRDSLLLKLTNEFELRSRNRSFYKPASSPLFFFLKPKGMRTLRKAIRDRRTGILLEKRLNSPPEIQLLPGRRYEVMTVEERQKVDIRNFLIRERSKINVLRRESRREREIRAEWDNLVIENQFAVLSDSVQK